MKVIGKVIPLALAVAGVALLSFWVGRGPAVSLAARVPGTDNAGAQDVEPGVAAKLRGTLVKGDGAAADLPGAWPRFRGPRFDGVCADAAPLARSWGGGGPKALWAVDVGEGHAGAAVLAGRVYVLDYDREAQADVVRCMSLADGKDIWRYAYPVKVKRFHGMSRTVPAVTEKHVVTLGPKCHVTCLDAVTGEFRWAHDLVREFKTKVPPWYAGQCPLIDGDRAIIAPGGVALMIAIDCATGDVIWKTPNPHAWNMTHSSVMPMEFNGRRMYVYCASGGVVGVAADDGSLLWETAEWKIRMANVPSPVIVGDGRIFLTGGYNAGSMMLQLRDDDGKLTAAPLFRLKPKVFDSPQHTPILFNSCLYGVRSDGRLACIDLNGKLLWASSGTERFGLGPYLIANGLIFVMDDAGTLTLAEATPAGYGRLARANVLSGHDSWGPMALAGDRLIVRDPTKMVCLDVGKR